MSKTWIDNFKKKEDTGLKCDGCAQKDTIITIQRDQKARFEDRIRVLEGEQEDLHVCSPQDTYFRVRTAIGVARLCREEFSGTFPQPLRQIANLLQDYSPIDFPSPEDVIATEDSYEECQLALRYAFPLRENVPAVAWLAMFRTRCGYVDRRGVAYRH